MRIGRDKLVLLSLMIFVVGGFLYFNVTGTQMNFNQHTAEFIEESNFYGIQFNIENEPIKNETRYNNEMKLDFKFWGVPLI
ncbi:MAG: hypothetical protein JW702_06000 [Clostridiales bacterium]|nr:hypothetical protein [Clostridiales bacterium]